MTRLLIRHLPVLLSLVSPLAAAEVLGSWTISALSRQCNPEDTACTYTLTLTTTYLPNPDHSRDNHTTTCSFTVLSAAAPPSRAEAAPAEKAKASKTDFAALPCTEESNTDGNDQDTNGNSRYMLNGGWELDVPAPGEEFLTLVVTDTKWDAYAFFGFREGELSDGSWVAVGGKTGVAYRVGTLGASGSASSSVSVKGGDEEVVRVRGHGSAAVGFEGRKVGGGSVLGKREMRLGMEMGIGRMPLVDADREDVRAGSNSVKRYTAEDKKEWQIKGLTRSPDTASNSTNWALSILDIQTGQETHCSFAVPSTDPTTSFYGKPCGADANAAFGISWGYNGNADSAVMTVCYAPNGTDAWFGYEQVSRSPQLGDSKKEPVHYTGCA